MTSPVPNVFNQTGVVGVGAFRVQNGVPEMQWVETCPGRPIDRYFWRALVGQPGDPATGAPPVFTTADLVPDLFEAVRRELPRPIPVVAPADRDPDGYAFVQHHTYFWVEEWAPISQTAAVPGLSLTMTAQPARVIVDPGDGGRVVCEGAPPALEPGDLPSQFRGGCGYIYRNSSATAPNGETFPVTVTIEWEITWTASNGESGTLDPLSTTSAPRDLPVAEVQAVITG